MISQDDLVSTTKTVTKGLESLRKEHESLLEVIASSEEEGHKDKELQMKCHQNVKQLLDLGLGEANVMTSLAGYLQSIEADHERLRSQILRLGQENNWLRDELEIAKVRLQVKDFSVCKLQYCTDTKNIADK